MSNTFDKAIPVIGELKSYTAVIKYCGLKLSGKCMRRCQKYLKDNNIDVSHFKNQANHLDYVSDNELIEVASKSKTIREICKTLKINYRCHRFKVKDKMNSLGIFFDDENIKKTNGYWHDWENNVLNEHWSVDKKQVIYEKLPNRSHDAIRDQAMKLKLKPLSEGFYNSNLQILLEEELESYYWIGFIYADGHFGSQEERSKLSIKLSNLDADHVEKFARYISYNGDVKSDSQFTNITLMNKEIGEKIKKKFDISNAKTYNPPSVDIFKNFTDEQFLSVLIGFIDGDGCIFVKNKKTKYAIITICCHSSWGDILTYFSVRINDIYQKGLLKEYSNKRGYRVVDINRTAIIHGLKNFAIKNNLPVMPRKWDKIDLNKIIPEDRKSRK